MTAPTRFLLLLSTAVTTSCWTPTYSRESADAQVYPILARAAERVSGVSKTFRIERPIDTLRNKLLETTEPVQLSLLEALDVAAENSRSFQAQKEQLYLSALNLTRSEHEFALKFGGGGSADMEGVSDDTADAILRDDLSASLNTVAGTRLVASFVNTFLRSVVNGGTFDGSSILDLTLTQPLLRGSGSRIVREPLTQAERNVIYQMRSFEFFRSDFATRVVSDYFSVVRQMQDRQNVEANFESVRQGRVRTQEEFNAGRKTISDLGREQQSELTAKASRVRVQSQLESALDQFKLTLGLPVTAVVQLDPNELEKLTARGVVAFDLPETEAIEIALQRRLDHRTVLDQVADASRRVAVSEDALEMGLDFTAALSVPSESGNGLNLDWSRVNWSAGFDLDLALDKLVERNAYRSSLISLDAQIRARENSEDSIAAEVRSALRTIDSAYDSYLIEKEALQVAQTRVESTTELYNAGRTQALEVIDAKDSLLSSQLQLTAAIVNYAIARIELLRDLGGLAMEPKGLRFDPALPIPKVEAEETP